MLRLDGCAWGVIDADEVDEPGVSSDPASGGFRASFPYPPPEPLQRFEL